MATAILRRVAYLGRLWLSCGEHPKSVSVDASCVGAPFCFPIRNLTLAGESVSGNKSKGKEYLSRENDSK